MYEDRTLPLEDRILREAPKPQANYRAVFARTERAPWVWTQRAWDLFDLLSLIGIVGLIFVAAWMVT